MPLWPIFGWWSYVSKSPLPSRRGHDNEETPVKASAKLPKHTQHRSVHNSGLGRARRHVDTCACAFCEPWAPSFRPAGRNNRSAPEGMQSSYALTSGVFYFNSACPGISARTTGPRVQSREGNSGVVHELRRNGSDESRGLQGLQGNEFPASPSQEPLPGE